VSPEALTTIRELDSRINNGIQVRLLWCKYDGRLWVAVVDMRTGETFRVRVRDGERPLDVFHHPYAYAAHLGSTVQAEAPDSETVVTSSR
jgi:hypothetical protein